LGGNSNDSPGHTGHCHAKDGPTLSSLFTTARKLVPECSRVSQSTLASLRRTFSTISFLGDADMALNRAPFGRWTLRDKAAQRRFLSRWGHQIES